MTASPPESRMTEARGAGATPSWGAPVRRRYGGAEPGLVEAGVTTSCSTNGLVAMGTRGRGRQRGAQHLSSIGLTRLHQL